MAGERLPIFDADKGTRAMDTPKIDVPSGQHQASPGRSISLKLRGGETNDSIMVFEETVPAGTKSTLHLHRDSDEVAYVLSGEVTFKVGDEVAVRGPGTCAFMPRGVPHAWKSTWRGNRARAVSVCAGAGRRVDRRATADRPQIRVDERARAGRHITAARLGASRTLATLMQTCEETDVRRPRMRVIQGRAPTFSRMRLEGTSSRQ